MGETVLAIAEKTVWGPHMLFLLLFCGLFLTVRTRFWQFRGFPAMLRSTVGSLVCGKKRGANAQTSGGAVSPFQALCTALSATIGTGNIAGVAYAIAMGGAGAVFWMWVAAFIGMITKYAESVLAVTYRVQTADGYRGGAMYYLKYGLAERFGLKRTGAALACFFSAATVAASFGIGNLSQVAAIRDSVLAAAGAPEGARGLLIAGIVMCAVAFVILGGAERIAKANERLVPFMAALYIGGSLVILLVHADRVLPVFGRIFREAFSLRSAAGGAGGNAACAGADFRSAARDFFQRGGAWLVGDGSCGVCGNGSGKARALGDV